MMQQISQQNLFITMYADGGITEYSLCNAMKAFRHTIKQLLHQYQYIYIYIYIYIYMCVLCAILKENS